MKRYIEIVYDNSGSMNERVGNKTKYEIAQELFEKDILPSIGLKGDHVVLRLLRNGCEDSISNAETLPNQRNLMLNRIKGINHNQSTPLFYTVFDSVESCRNVRADEYLIFVLTDGDDTCGVRIEDLIDEDTLKKYVRFYKVLLVQLAVNSPISRNNLTAFTNALGGQAISLDSSDSIPQMRKKLKLALNVSGFTNKFPLEHCFDILPGFDMAWEEIEEAGINFHQAMLLHHKGLLTWMPDYSLGVSSLQSAELRFLFSLLFKSGIPEDLLKTMLSQLKKPYYYSFDCIYWDFASARWRNFIQQNQIQQLPNKEARFEDYPENEIMEDVEWDNTHYEENRIYRVELNPTAMPTFELIQDDLQDAKTEATNISINKKVRILEPGDLVKFKL
jgi:hypothetical protein